MPKFIAFLSNKKKILLFIILFIAVSFIIYLLQSIAINTQLSETGYIKPGAYPSYPAYDIRDKPTAQIAQIKRGEYLVKAGDCIACHTQVRNNSAAFAGGLAMQMPFGVIHTPNITPDKETGIGKWTEEQFVKAMHEGISPQGYYYFPAFPYLYFNKMSVSDLKAIKAYLDIIPAVKQHNKPNEMIFPFNIRFMQLGWRLLFFYPEKKIPFYYNPSRSEEWNIGAYIVQGPGHCAMCHTPSYYIINPEVTLGAPIRKYDLTGANIEGYFAPNITQSNLGGIPDSELLKIFTQYQLIGGSPIQGPMAEAIHDSLMQLPKRDLLGILQYLKTVQSKLPLLPKIRTTDIGKDIYNNYCSACHESGISGAPRFGDASTWESLSRSGPDSLYRIAIRGGGNMPAKGTCITCSNVEIRAAVDYMIVGSKGGEESQSRSQPVSMATPEQLYQSHCSSCHSSAQSKAPQLGDLKAWQPIEAKGFLKAYRNIVTGQNGHPKEVACQGCSDKEILAALKYMMQKGSTQYNYNLW